MARDIVIVGGARTPIGSFGGSLKDIPAHQLGTHVVSAALARADVEAAAVEHLVCGLVIPTEARDLYISRVIALQAGLAASSGALTLNRLCGSGLQAIVTAAQTIQLGDADIAVAAGVESMSRAGHLVSGNRFGTRMGDVPMVDLMIGALTDPFSTTHMGITAENIAESWQISRDDQDRFALASQTRALHAIGAGYFRDQIAPVPLKSRGETRYFDTDEYPRATTLEALAQLRPAFKPQGTVTAGNASGINDAAAAVVLMEAKAAERAGKRPLARLVSYGLAGVAPEIMGTGPIPASQLALQRAGLTVADMDVIESNEAFAAQALCVTQGLGLDPDKVNPNGGAIALGHALAATGTILTLKCLYELQRTGKRYGLVTLCIGGGQGITAIFERC